MLLVMAFLVLLVVMAAVDPGVQDEQHDQLSRHSPGLLAGMFCVQRLNPAKGRSYLDSNPSELFNIHGSLIVKP